MLFGLLAYDVFWVFGSPAVIGDNVMLAVATSDALTGPTRLLFPRFAGSIGEASRFPFSLLGEAVNCSVPFSPVYMKAAIVPYPVRAWAMPCMYVARKAKPQASSQT